MGAHKHSDMLRQHELLWRLGPDFRAVCVHSGRARSRSCGSVMAPFQSVAAVFEGKQQVHPCLVFFFSLFVGMISSHLKMLHEASCQHLQHQFSRGLLLLTDF